MWPKPWQYFLREESIYKVIVCIFSGGNISDVIFSRFSFCPSQHILLYSIGSAHGSLSPKIPHHMWLWKRIIKAYVWLTLLQGVYGCETWTITTRNMTKLQSFEMWPYRKMMKISWREKKTNKEVLTLADEQLYIIPTIKKRKLPTLVTWTDVTTSTGCCWRVHWRGKEAEEGQELSGWQPSQNDGDAIRRPRETCSRSGAMEDHDSQPSQRRWHLIIIIILIIN